MHLKRLDIHGFKSFAQKTTLEFEPGIVAIVGPNGSGKSNVADSVRWVLGEQSLKQLRGKKSDDVVFAGSDKRSRGGFAEVVATFDNSDHRIPLDASEVSIGRRVDRTGESEYLINGARVRLLDVIDLVLKSNIGTSRYTVIGQGTIDQLILAGPSEIKSLLDEASGVKTYQGRREKTLRRLEQTAQNLMRAEDVVAEIEPRLRSLRRQAKRMADREGLETELKLLQRERLGGSYFSLATQIGALTKQLDELKVVKVGLENKFEQGQVGLEQTIKNSGAELDRLTTLRREMLGLQEQKNRLLEQRSILQGKIAGSRTAGTADPVALQLQVSQLEIKLTNINTQLEQAGREFKISSLEEQEFEAKRKDIERKLQELYKLLAEPSSVDVSAYRKVVDLLQSSVEGFLDHLETTNSLSEFKNAVQSFKATYRALKAEATTLIGKQLEYKPAGPIELQELHELKSDLEKKLSIIAARRAGAETSVRLLEEQMQSVSQEHLSLRLELQKVSSVGTSSFAEQLAQESGKLDQQIVELQNKLQNLEAQLTGINAREEQRRHELADLEKSQRLLQEEIYKIKDQESLLLVEKAKYDTQIASICEQIQQIFGEEVSNEIIRTSKLAQTPDLVEKIDKLKAKLELIGGVDEMTMQEFRETEERFTRLSEQIADLKRGMEDLRQVMDELDEHIKSKFNEAFHKINERFEHYFRILFNGGRAQLLLVKDEDKPETLPDNSLEELSNEEVIDALRPEEKLVKKYELGASQVVGVDIRATPPGKKLANIQALSGGERALTSIALLCSLLACFPSPFVVLDEVDAALDEANTIRFGQILGTLAHQTQFVTITHNRETMAQSKMLYGVTMGDDSVSKILSLKFDQAKEFAK